MKKIIPLFLCIALLFSGCVKRVNKSGENEKNQAIAITKYDKLTKISDVVAGAETDFNNAKLNKYENIVFSDDMFLSVPDFSEVSMLRLLPIKNVALEEKVEMIKSAIDKWCPGGYKDEMYDKIQFTFNCVNEEGPQKYSDPSEWPLLSKEYNLCKEKDGDLYFSNNNINISLWDYSIISMEKLYEGEEFRRPQYNDDLTVNDYDEPELIGSYTDHNGKGKVFKLKDGEMTYEQVKTFAEKFYSEELIYKHDADVTIDIPKIRVYENKKGDISLKVSARRAYNNVPLEYACLPLTMKIMSDCKDYGAEDTSIEIRHVNDVCKLQQGFGKLSIKPCGESYKEIISLGEAIDIMSDKLAGEIKFNVKSATINYIYYLDKNHPDYSNEDLMSNPYIGQPAWIFEGTSNLDDRNLRVYVNALTGQLTYRTISGQN